MCLRNIKARLVAIALSNEKKFALALALTKNLSTRALHSLSPKKVVQNIVTNAKKNTSTSSCHSFTDFFNIKSSF